jgi:ATP-dependent DNA helicase RecG
MPHDNLAMNFGETDIRDLLSGSETSRLEWKAGLSSTQELSEVICAFANDLDNSRAPGHLMLGVDKKGLVSGRRFTDAEVSSLGNLRDNGNIQPLPSLTIHQCHLPEGDVIVIRVEPSALAPVRFQGRVHVRLGPRQATATEQDEKSLFERRVSHARTFDAQPCLDASIVDLTAGLFRNEYLPRVVAQEVIDENHRALSHQLASLRFVDAKTGVPTNAGILLFGLDVRYFLPGAYIQFIRVDGTALTDTITNESEHAGDLMSVLRELDSVVKANVQRAPRFTTALREELVEDIPSVALREILMNAVMHRDYASNTPIRFVWLSDRVEVHSPGGLYGEAAPNKYGLLVRASAHNFPTQTSYRNPIVAEAMKALGYVNRFGRGVFAAQAAMERNGNPPVEFHIHRDAILATLKVR